MPGRPLVLANVYDVLSAAAFARIPLSSALATASYAVARAAGTEDDYMTIEQNLAAVRLIVYVAVQYEKPLTVDLQDGYVDRLAEAPLRRGHRKGEEISSRGSHHGLCVARDSTMHKQG